MRNKLKVRRKNFYSFYNFRVRRTMQKALYRNTICKTNLNI
nr:MAG TPA: hypothetical protein [Caudoviricetes sp.]